MLLQDANPTPSFGGFGLKPHTRYPELLALVLISVLSQISSGAKERKTTLPSHRPKIGGLAMWAMKTVYAKR